MRKITMMSKQYNIIFYIYFSLALIILASIRPIGFDADLIGYYTLMEKIIKFDYILIEPAFVLIVKLSYSFFGEEYYQRVVVIIFSILHISILSYAFYKLSKCPIYSLLLYLLLFYSILGLTQIRYSILVSLFLLSIPNIINRNIIGFYIKIFIAISFHYSGILFLIFYFLNPNVINKTKYFLLLLISTMMPLLHSIFLKLIVSLNDNGFFPKYVYNKIYHNLILNSDKLSFSIFNIFRIYIIFIYIQYLFTYKVLSKKNVVLMKILGIGIFLYMLFSFSPTISFRMLNGIIIVVVLLMVNLQNLYKESNIVIIIIIFISLLLFLNTVVRNELLNWSVLF